MAPTDVSPTTTDGHRKRCPGGWDATGQRSKTPGHRRVAGQGQDHRRLARVGLRRRVLHRAHPGPPPPGRRGSCRLQGRGLVPARGRRRQRLQAPLCGLPRQEVPGGQVQALVKQASEVYLASDEDREGESIAWHLLEVLAPRVPVKRMVFHEITRPAIERAVRVAGPRPPPGRRPGGPSDPRPPVRLRGIAGPVEEDHAPAVGRAGCRPSPPGWWSSGNGRGSRSPGRVVGDRRHFTTAASPRPRAPPARSPPPWPRWTGCRLATGRDFEQTGTLASPGSVVVLDEDPARALAARSRRRATSRSVADREAIPPLPGRALHDLDAAAGGGSQAPVQRPADHAGRPAPLRGRLDHLHADRLDHAVERGAARRPGPGRLRSTVRTTCRPQPRRYERKVKNAQEAHEAIRPAGDTFRTPDEAARSLHGDELRLYELIWKRTVASQMTDATGTSAHVRLVGASTDTAGAGRAKPSSPRRARSSSSRVPAGLRRGRRRPRGRAGRPRGAPAAHGRGRPAVGVGPRARVAHHPAAGPLHRGIAREGHGGARRRPASTYASVIATILDRGYVWKKGTALVPSSPRSPWSGCSSDTSPIWSTTGSRLPWRTTSTTSPRGTRSPSPGSPASTSVTVPMQRYRRDPGGPKEARSQAGGEHISARSTPARSTPSPSAPVRTAADRGPGRSLWPLPPAGEDRASMPDDLAPDELTVERAEELLEAPSSDRVLGDDPETGLPVQVRAGRFGPYVQLGELVDGGPKPRTSSLFAIDVAGHAHVRPGARPAAPPPGGRHRPRNGRGDRGPQRPFGPYLKRGSETRSLVTEDQILTVGLDEALALFAQPKTRGRAGGPLRELGADPDTGAPWSSGRSLRTVCDRRNDQRLACAGATTWRP